MKTEEKCVRFWLTNLNPITMKKNDNTLHIQNRSPEQEYALRQHRAKTLKIDYDHQILEPSGIKLSSRALEDYNKEKFNFNNQ
tara:strand:- start:154 stop:402 length:249 start_codon:yes stop_codon:yes gene_type:complete